VIGMTAATDTDLVPMRVSKAVTLQDGDDLSQYMVLDELDGDRHLVIGVGQAEASPSTPASRACSLVVP
jgi:hypothetical protein